jgi:putative cell wall-binding protein
MATRRASSAAIGVFAMLLTALTPSAPATAATPVGTVGGVVTTAAGPLPTGTMRVWATTDGYNSAGASGVYGPAAVDPTTGAYTLPSLATGKYFLSLDYLGTENYVRTTYSPGRLAGEARVATNVAEGSQSADFRLEAGSTISGTVSASDGSALDSFLRTDIRIFSATGSGVESSVSFDSATGAYVASRIPPGDVSVRFGQETIPASRWVQQYWDGAGDIPTADVIHLDAGSTVSGVDPVLHLNPVIHGVVTWEGSGAPVVGVGVSVQRVGSGYTSPLSTGSDGQFTTVALAPGDYTVCIEDGFTTSGVLPECWNDGTPVTVGPDQTLDLDFSIVKGASIRGSVWYVSPITGGLKGAVGTSVVVYKLNESEGFFETYDVVDSGSLDNGFEFRGLPVGTYALRFLAGNAAQNEILLNSEYWENARYWAERTDIVVTDGADVALGNVVLEPRSLDIGRLQGADRFDVGVEISQALFPTVPAGGVPVVYVASGYNFPDALVAGPAAARHGGGVLLVEPTAIPAAVAAELARLRPQRIVVAGGPASVTPSVYSQLRSYVSSSSDIFRANGIDRYEASRALIRDAFDEDGATMAIITTGGNFPDALSAGPAAASQNAPVILVDGTASRIDSATRQLLVDLGVQRIYIAGGTGSVSPGIETSLGGLVGSGNVHRFAGTDRFEVGVLISQAFFGGDIEHVFVATAYKFPDALTGGPLAAAYGGPLYLSPPECLPTAVAIDILDLDAQQVVLLGGPASLTPAVERLQLC